ncbi:hypothetical protein NDI44_27570 [Trichocoleus sp. DQ-A3]|uniref:hypothetical protein n=1 Tax=Cyanophyceae TaxID=3028117 RepID=UPI0016863DFF|nr:hypothetical protein [Coleofasciculus sp. FACHB-125]MBD1903631.1 hypothetical protein [Coleofasciculus sp. FACHB-125]
MTKKRPQKKKTALTDKSNILAVQPSPQKVAPENVQPSTASIENPIDDAASTPVPVEPQTVDSWEPSLDTSLVPVTFDSPPTEEPVPEPSDSSASSPNAPRAFFQAVGILTVEVTFEAEKTFVSVGGKTYPLYYSSSHKQAYIALKKEIETTGISQQKLIVYPRITHYPGGKQPYSLTFQLVGFVKHGTAESNTGVSSDLQDLEFKICGLWQFIPVCRIPCISVFKNFNQERLEFIKSAEVDKKVNFMKASHLPVFWKDALVPPFRFNPKLNKETQGKAFFVQIKARFNSERNTFEFISLLAIPSAEPPKYLKAGKKDKFEVAKTRLEASKARQRDDARSHNDAAHSPRKTPSAPKPKPKPKVVSQP